MTDEQLMELLRQKTPEELSLDEIDYLQQRLADSAPLREALLSQLQMETYLTAALGRISLSPHAIVAKAEQQQSRGATPIILLLVLLVCLPVVALTGAVLLNAVRGSQEIVADVVVDAEPPESASAAPDTAAESASKVADPDQASEAETRPAADPAENPAKPVASTPENEPAQPAAPWASVLASAEEQPTFEQIAFQNVDPEQARPQQADLANWFEGIVAHNFRVHELDTKKGRCGAIEGVARLKSPWTNDSVLRMALERHNELQIHLYHGQHGVTLVYNEIEGDRWTAYATTRAAAGVKPETMAITSTDDDRCRRTETRFGGPIELRWRDGEILLSRGDIVLVTAPLSGLPDDVYFEGRAAFHELKLVRTSTDPQPLAARVVTLAIDKPAELDWQRIQPAGPEIEKLADGSVRLATEEALKSRVEWFAPLPRTGLCEIVVQLDGVTAGSSVYLGREGGQPLEVLRFLHNRRGGQLVARLQGVNDEQHANLEPFNRRPEPIVQSTCWIKFLHGCGNLRWWLSTDGKHWAQVAPAQDNVRPQITSIGLQLVAKRPKTAITLRRIEFRELTALTSLADRQLWEKAVSLPTATKWDEWQTAIVSQQPPEIDAAAWRVACALRTLASGPSRSLAYPLLESVLDEQAFQELPIELQLRVLDDALLMCLDLRDSAAMRRGLPQRILDVGRRAYIDHGLPPWSTVRRLAMSVPIVTTLKGAYEPEPLIRWELIHSIYRQPPQQTLDLCRQLRFFEQHQKLPLVEWAEATARRELPDRERSPRALVMKDSWRHPLVEKISKETYTALTELQSVLDSEAWDDAARLLTTLDPQSLRGVAPYVRDDDLLVSAPVAIRLMMADHPQLRETLIDQYAPLARLRLSQAISAGDWPLVELAAVQFAGTPEVAAAHRWLGDRALANGWFERAIEEYRRAEEVQPSLAGEVAPRVRLAAAMLGRDVGQPITQPVSVGETQFNAQQFESLVAEMRGRGDVEISPSSAARDFAVTGPIPAPASFKSTTRAPVDGHVGDKPAEEVGRKTNQFRIPWPDRQLAAAVEGNTLYVSNRFQVAAYNLPDGKRLWRSEPPASPAQRSQEWACIPMRPLVTSRRIFARQLYTNNPLLVCLEKQGGRTIWFTQLSDREFFVSDPVLVRGQLGVLSIALQESQEGLLRWNLLDAETGELQSQHDLIRLRNTWGARACGELSLHGDSLIAVLGGMTLSFEPTGDIRWIRTHLVLPAEDDPRWIVQQYQRPILHEGRLLIAQPGVRSVECLDTASGTLKWSVVLPDLVGMVGLAGDRFIVQTEQGLQAINRIDGAMSWRHDVNHLHPFQLAADDAVLYACREPAPDKPNHWQSRFVWLDPATGEQRGSTVVPQFTHDDPKIGPLIAHDNRVWTFFGRGQHDPNRELVELAPNGPPERLAD